MTNHNSWVVQHQASGLFIQIQFQDSPMVSNEGLEYTCQLAGVREDGIGITLGIDRPVKDKNSDRWHCDMNAVILGRVREFVELSEEDWQHFGAAQRKLHAEMDAKREAQEKRKHLSVVEKSE